MAKTQEDDRREESLRQEYVSRINRVIDYIQANLDKDLSLEVLSDVACFSQFHFHRIFRAMVGETLGQFIQRVRIVKAAGQLIANPKKPITEIALDCGFSDSATFARAFKGRFNVSASEWRTRGGLQDRKIRKMNSKKGQVLSRIRKDIEVSSRYVDDKTNNLTWRIRMKDKKHVQVEVKDMPELHVAYIRFIGSIKENQEAIGNLYEKLMNWAAPRGLLRFPETKVLAVYPDHLKLTEDDKRRTDACITVTEDTPAEGEVGRMVVPGGKCAVARLELVGTEDFFEAWDTVYGEWMPGSGYQPDDRPGYEIYLNEPKEHPEGISITDLCAPVRPL